MEYSISNMETKRLFQFKCIVDTGGLVKAGELLGISGGGLSKSIRVLEDELGFKLFYRNGRDLEVTDLGRKFYDRLPEVLSAIESLVDLDKEISQKKNEVIRFVSFEVFTTYFLSDFINQNLKSELVEIRERTPGAMEELIASGEADIGITYEPIPHKGVSFLKVSTLKMRMYGVKNVYNSYNSLEELPFVIPITPLSGAPSGNKGLDGWPDHLFERNIKYKVEMMETAILLAQHGRAVVFLPEFIVNYVNQRNEKKLKLQSIPLPKKFKQITRDIYIILRKNEEENAITKKLARSLRKISSST